MPRKLLILIPTYNERENVTPICEQIVQVVPEADVLFIDDGSPDGTGAVLDALAQKHPRVQVMHRPGKMGVGSAHLAGIERAYQQGYDTLITLDCDFTHSPADILRLLDAAQTSAVAVGSRWVSKDSLPGWSMVRRLLTNVGHFLTKNILGMPFDATSGFRIYQLDRIPQALFAQVKSPSYAFFFESLFVLHRNACCIREVPIRLPAHTYGHSKLSFGDAMRSIRRLVGLCKFRLTAPPAIPASASLPEINPNLIDPQGWAPYWEKKSTPTTSLYGIIAAIYRTQIIRRHLDRAIKSEFAPGAALLHAGCGSGQVDDNLGRIMNISAVDICFQALTLYCKSNPNAVDIRHASILDLPFPDNSFDGVYNLGVLEHFTPDEAQQILAECHRVLKPSGKIVIFWPHMRASSVFVLGVVHWILNRVLRLNVQLHPPEINLMTSKSMARATVEKAGFDLTTYSFGPGDGFVQAVMVASKQSVHPRLIYPLIQVQRLAG